MAVASTRNMKKPMVLTSATILAVTVSVAAFYRTSAGGDAPTYNTATVTRGDVVETVEATGTLEAVTTVQVGIAGLGHDPSLNADFNSRVKKGQVDCPARPVAASGAGRPGRGDRRSAAGRHGTGPGHRSTTRELKLRARHGAAAPKS